MKSIVSNILSKLIVFLDNAGFEPAKGSPAAIEIRSFPRQESMETAFGMASQSLIAATDYYEALDYLIIKEEFAIAPWSCARGMLESSALCTWLFEMDIDPKDRVGRSLSLRYSALREQQKMARCDGNTQKVKDIEERIDSIERIAINLGYALVRDRNNRRIGIGQKKPYITTLVESQFSGEKFYRMLSGMAHSNYTTLTELSFTKPNFSNKGGAVIQRAIPTELHMSLLSWAGVIYAKCLWLKTKQFGFDAAKMAILLEEFYDVLKLPDTNKERFWRTIIGISS